MLGVLAHTRMFGLFLLAPLHHPGGVESDNFVQRFIDSDTGVVLASTFHTLGALLFTAGIALYLFQARIVSLAKAEGQEPSLRWLPLAHILNVAGIGLNGMGGLMRLKQGDHPGLEMLGTSFWVQILLVKHLFLVVGVGLALFLTARTYLMGRKAEAPKNFLPESRRITTFAIAAFITIVAASVMGALAGNTDLPTMDEGTGTAVGGAQGTGVLGAPATTSGVYYSNSTGTITGSPVAPGRGSDELIVQTGATELVVQIIWSSMTAVLDGSVLGPDGTPVQLERTADGTRVELVAVAPLAAGKYSVLVTSERAVNEQYQIVSRITVGTPTGAATERTFTVQPGGALGFAEINLAEMAVGDEMTYEWRVVDSGASVYFDIHMHIDGQDVKPIEGTWNSHAGTYRHEHAETDSASMLWQNDGAMPLRVEVRFWGDFVIDSEVYN